MREAAGEFAPGGDAFDLHEFFALLDELAGHLVKGFGKLGDFVVAMNLDTATPVAVGDFTRGGDEFLHRSGYPRGAPPAEQQAEQEADGGDAQRQPADATFERDDGALRAADKQDAQQFFLAADQRERVKNFGVRGIKAPADFFGLLDGIGFDFFDQRLETIGVGRGTFVVDEIRFLKIGGEIQIEQGAHIGGQNEGAEKFFAEALTADDVQIAIANADGGDRHQTESGALIGINLHQESAARGPVVRLGNPREFVTEAGGIFLRGDDRAVVADEIEKIQLVRTGNAAGVVDVNGNIGVGTAEVDGHAGGGFFFGDGFDAVGHVLAATFEFVLELLDHGVGVLAVQLIEDAAGDESDAGGDQANRQEQRDDEIQKQLGAKRHAGSFIGALAALASGPSAFGPPAFGPSSQTSASGQFCPGAGGIQFRTRALRP